MGVDLTNDQAVVDAILRRDQRITQQYLYVRCYPMFKSVFDNYYTDCCTCIEFINEIYVHLLSPNRKTGMCKLETFQFKSTLATWLKMVAIYFCYEHFRRKKKVTFVEEKKVSDDYVSDRFDKFVASTYEETNIMAWHDMERVLGLMPNKRYSMVIRLRYMNGLSNEETAVAMQMSMDNFYNIHMRAKKQFCEMLNRMI